MKKSWKIIVFLLWISIFVGACGKQKVVIEETLTEKPENRAAITEENDKEDSFSEESLLYETYVQQLDQMLERAAEREAESEPYLEEIYSNYYFSKAYHGGLQAMYDTEGIASVKMVLLYGEEEKETDDKQQFHLRLLEDGSFWVTYQSTYDEIYDLPDYMVNEDVMRYSRTDYNYGDESVDLEEKRTECVEKVTGYLEEVISGKKEEYWYFQDKVYRVDREKGYLVDVTHGRGGLIVSFVQQQPERIACQLKVSEEVLTEVEKWKPKEYSYLRDWNQIAVSDLNGDGMEDYVLALYPDDYEEEQRYEDGNPYEKTSQYYAASFWLLLSKENQEYRQILLSDTIEYREDNTLSLVDISFVKEDILQLEYFIGRSPFEDVVVQFQYNEEKENFYMYKSFFRKYIGSDYYVFLTGNQENYGDISLGNYFVSNQRYQNHKWKSVDGIQLTERAVLEYYSDGFQYGSANLLEENHVNSLIWEKEYQIAQVFMEQYSDMQLEFSMVSDPLFYGKNIISGMVEIYGSAVSGNDKYDIESVDIPIMIDRIKGDYLKVTDRIGQDKFLEIFQAWASDKRRQSVISSKEKSLCETAICEYWDSADSLEQYVGNPYEILSLQIVSEGVMINIMINQRFMEGFVIDKEYFIDTPLWRYMEPKWNVS